MSNNDIEAALSNLEDTPYEEFVSMLLNDMRGIYATLQGSVLILNDMLEKGELEDIEELRKLSRMQTKATEGIHFLLELHLAYGRRKQHNDTDISSE